MGINGLPRKVSYKDLIRKEIPKEEYYGYFQKFFEEKPERPIAPFKLEFWNKVGWVRVVRDKLGRLFRWSK